MDALELCRTFHALDPERVDDVLTDDFRGRQPFGHTWDREAHRRFLRSIRSSFSDIRDEVHGTIVEGDRMAVWFTRSGHQDGTWMGRPATGNELRLEACHYVTIRGGRIAEIIEFFDHRQVERFTASAGPSYA